MTREELLKSPEYWTLEIQMKLYQVISDFMEKNNINRKHLADKLGFSKGYISQILNGEFDHRISKMVELALSVGKVPAIEFEDIDQIIIDDMYNLLGQPKSERPVINLQINPEMKMKLSKDQVNNTTFIKSNTTFKNISIIEQNISKKNEEENNYA